MKIAGVYKITNIITGDFYIGSSKNIKKRWAKHKCPSSWKNESNKLLYHDFQEYGLENFLFEIIEETANLYEREQYWIDKLKPIYNNYRAKDLDVERYKEYQKKWHEAHQEEMSAYNKEWYEFHRDEQLTKCKTYYSRLCFYEGKILTLRALSIKFSKQGIEHPTITAKKYLLKN